jgi:4-hydroxy-4-methyl-2-oxoglutarate aldolase
MPRSEIVARLLKLDSCAVSDATDQLGLKGAALGIHPLSGTTRIAGQVVTVKLKTKGAEQSTRHLGTAAIEAAAPGDVIVVEHPGREDAAGWGGILSNAAKVKGVGGVIVDGPCRDIDESRELGFPVFGKGATPMTARGRIVEESFNEPIVMSGIAVQPGDFVLADGSGVVFIAAEHAEEVVTAAESIAAREAAMTRAVLAGQSVIEVMGRNYETMLSRGA